MLKFKKLGFFIDISLTFIFKKFGIIINNYDLYNIGTIIISSCSHHFYLWCSLLCIFDLLLWPYLWPVRPCCACFFLRAWSHLKVGHSPGFLMCIAQISFSSDTVASKCFPYCGYNSPPRFLKHITFACITLLLENNSKDV